MVESFLESCINIHFVITVVAIEFKFSHRNGVFYSFINYNLDWFDCFENWFSIEIFFILCTGKIILKLKNFRAEFAVIESRLIRSLRSFPNSTTVGIWVAF